MYIFVYTYNIYLESGKQTRMYTYHHDVAVETHRFPFKSRWIGCR